MRRALAALVLLAASLALGAGALAAPPGQAAAAPVAQFDYAGRANQRYEAGDYQGAVEDYTRAIQGSRNNDRSRYDAYVGRGNARARLNDLTGAIDDFTHALLFANAPEAFIGRADARAAARETGRIPRSRLPTPQVSRSDPMRARETARKKLADNQQDDAAG